MSLRAEQYIAYLQTTIGRPYDNIVGVEPENDAMHMAMAVIFNDYPEAGFTTVFSYGLSEAEHNDDWQEYKPELSLTVASSQIDWANSLAFLVDWYRSKENFLPGSLFDFGRPISSDTPMDAFLVFNRAIGRADEFENITLDTDRVKVLGIYPIYKGEIYFLLQIGIKKFISLPGFEVFNPQRPDLSKIYKIGENKG